VAELLSQRSSARDLWSRLIIFGVVAALCFLVLLGRLYRLQVSLGHEYYDRSVNNYVKDVKIPADRGLLVDRRGEVLATSRPSFDLELTPHICGKSCDEVVGRLSAYLGLTDDEQAHVHQKLRETRGLSRFKPFTVKVDIGREALDVYEAHRAEIGAAVDLIPTPHRYYPMGTLGAHTLGYLSEVGPDELDGLQAQGKDYHEGDYLGRRGIERAFEPYLRGVDGVEHVAVDAKGTRLPDLNEEVRPARAGRNVVLSIDERLQKAAEDAFPGKAGAVVALDPNTGFILALVSRPELDPNLLTGRVTRAQLAELAADPYKPEMFRPLQGQYHPGSTFKPVTALAGLQHHAITPETPFVCTGGYTLGHRRWRCFKETGHGPIKLHEAIARSCDAFFYWVGDKLGLDGIAETARALGLGKPTGIGLDNEVPGVIPDEAYADKVIPGGYQKGQALNTAIGQGDVNVTPLQMAVLYAAIGNGGTVYQPQVVRRIEDSEGKTIKTFEPIVRQQLPVDPDSLAAVVSGLVGVVNEPGGTTYGHRLKDIVVAGKTGTAQVIAMGAERVKSTDLDYWQGDHAWFDSFAPADKPEIAVVVLNEHGGYGAAAAAPTAMAVIQAFFEEKKADEAAHAGPAATPPPTEPAKDEHPAPPQPPKKKELGLREKPFAPSEVEGRSLRREVPRWS
jgi:penicillin-binding protein 2